MRPTQFSHEVAAKEALDDAAGGNVNDTRVADNILNIASTTTEEVHHAQGAWTIDKDRLRGEGKNDGDDGTTQANDTQQQREDVGGETTSYNENERQCQTTHTERDEQCIARLENVTHIPSGQHSEQLIRWDDIISEWDAPC